jgi:hypothetical protein
VTVLVEAATIMRKPKIKTTLGSYLKIENKNKFCELKTPEISL